MLLSGKVDSNYAAKSPAFFLQVAVVVYGADPRVHFLLSRHSSGETLLSEIDSIPFSERPGNNLGGCDALCLDSRPVCSLSPDL